MKKFVYILAALPIIYFTAYAHAQNPTPNDGMTHSAYPKSVAKPSQSVDPYGLSSLNSSTGSRYRKGAGTLGTVTTGRPSNSEINKAIQEKRAKDRKNQNERRNSVLKRAGAENDLGVRDFSSTRKSGSSKIIRWVDDEGITHITNNVGSVPAKYRSQVK